MEGPFCMFVISVFFVSTKGECPMHVGNNSITSCEGSTKYGPNIYIDFSKINRACTCTVSSSFEGELFVTSEEIHEICYTKVQVIYFENTFDFICKSVYSGQTLNVQINDSAEIRAEYVSPYTSGTFYHCLGFQRNGGINGNLNVTCGSSTKTTITTTTTLTTISKTTITSTQLFNASSPFVSSRVPTSVVNTTGNTDANPSSNTINASYGSMSMDSTQDDPEMLYIIAGSAGGGAILLVGLIVLILVLINRTRNARSKCGSTEADTARTNEVFDNNPELPDNPLYLSSQPMHELGYSSDQVKQLGLPPTDSKTKKKMNSNYDVPPNNKPIYHGAPSMPVYAVPKRSNDRTPEVSTGDVYAEVCKPNRGTEQTTATTKQTNVNDKNEITEGVRYAEIKRT